ncbi:uncharacterized protein LOC132314246 [Cornus florida]|uniref:uncharacterized protein LOC132314246 n=1 Tax=Cornus florida TaxID=4283 RepID=UPI002899F7C5|nr:uncharacterized protein LOC132314246 [Cornus florida]
MRKETHHLELSLQCYKGDLSSVRYNDLDEQQLKQSLNKVQTRKGKREIRQGDPISPMLFVLAMEVLSLSLGNAVSNSPSFKFHWRCNKLSITHLAFADDLLLFSFGNLAFVTVLHNVLTRFLQWSGLSINCSKSHVFFSGVDNQTKVAILNLLLFDAGVLPLTYLGLPLTSSAISATDCQSLVQKITLELYCSNPSSTLSKLIGLKHSSYPKKSLNKPKNNGGLGFDCIDLANRVAGLNHIWKLCAKKNSLWVNWTYKYLIKNKNFWTVKPTSLSSGFWRKLLKQKEMARRVIKHRIGTGPDTMMWIDFWLPNGPLYSQLGLSEVEILQLDTSVKVDSLISNSQWSIPASLQQIPFLNSNSFNSQLHSLHTPSASPDLIEWLPSLTTGFSQRTTMDYFCPPSLLNCWTDLITWCSSNWQMNHFTLHKLLLSAAVYFIWFERNARAFKNKASSAQHIIQLIKSCIRSRLSSLVLKKEAELNQRHSMEGLQKMFLDGCAFAGSHTWLLSDD